MTIETGIPETVPSGVELVRYIAPPATAPATASTVATGLELTTQGDPGVDTHVDVATLPDTSETWRVTVRLKEGEIANLEYAFPLVAEFRTGTVGDLTAYRVGATLDNGNRYILGHIRYKLTTTSEERVWVGFVQALNIIHFAAEFAADYVMDIERVNSGAWKERIVFTPVTGNAITANIKGGGDFNDLEPALVMFTLPKGVYTWEAQYGLNNVWTAYANGVTQAGTAKELSLAKDISILEKINDTLEARFQDRADIAAYTVGGRNISTIPITELQQLKLRYERRIRTAQQKGRRYWYVEKTNG